MAMVDESKLEELVDLCGLEAVVDALVGICAAKAEHLEVSWQDYGQARLWIRAANRLTTTHTAIKKLCLP